MNVLSETLVNVLATLISGLIGIALLQFSIYLRNKTSLIQDEQAKGIEYSREVVGKIKDYNSLGIFIGPEGGFAEEEVELAKSIGAECITLGRRILRTETAGLATLSIIMFEIDS